MKSKQVMIILIAILVCLGSISLYIVDFFRNPFIPHWRLIRGIDSQTSVELQLIPDESAQVLSLKIINHSDNVYLYHIKQLLLHRDWIYRWRPLPPFRLDGFGIQDMATPLHPNSYDEIIDIPFEFLDNQPNGEYIIITHAWRYDQSQRNSFRVAVRFSLPLN